MQTFWLKVVAQEGVLFDAYSVWVSAWGEIKCQWLRSAEGSCSTASGGLRSSAKKPFRALSLAFTSTSAYWVRGDFPGSILNKTATAKAQFTSEGGKTHRVHSSTLALETRPHYICRKDRARSTALKILEGRILIWQSLAAGWMILNWFSSSSSSAVPCHSCWARVEETNLASALLSVPCVLLKQRPKEAIFGISHISIDFNPRGVARVH